jgi:hypothetical protein
MANPRIPYRFSNEGPQLTAHPEGAIMVHLVVNVEHWQFDAGMPRTILTSAGLTTACVPAYHV